MQYYQDSEAQAIFINCDTRSVSRVIVPQNGKSAVENLITDNIIAFRNITIGKTKYEMWHAAFATIENSCGAFRVVSPCGDTIIGNAVLFPRRNTEKIKEINEVYNSIFFLKKQYSWQPLELDEEEGDPYWEKCHSARDLAGAR